MAASVRILVGANGNSFLERKSGKKKNFGGRRNATVMASVAFPGMKEEYKTLRLSPGAAEKDIKKAYRRLALQYHPDVCKGDNCGVQFQRINQAYETVMSSLAKAKQQSCSADYYVEGMVGVNNDSWDEWEEWMGWEGAGTLDYSSHINIYA
uniref:J domain-containing protein n=1 Tax=Picea sitchensis TaxID=3332 RepID=D5AC87_PICSI|nr:unknown [Picea sitchensis]